MNLLKMLKIERFLSVGRPDFHSQVASFFRFMAAKTSIACTVTFSSPRPSHAMLFLHIGKYAFNRFFPLSVNLFVLLGMTQMIRFFDVMNPDVSAHTLRVVFTFRALLKIRTTLADFGI